MSVGLLEWTIYGVVCARLVLTFSRHTRVHPSPLGPFTEKTGLITVCETSPDSVFHCHRVL